MPKFKEKQRRVVEQRIQEAGRSERGAIGQFREFGLQGLGEAPTIQGIRDVLTQRPRELDEMRQALFGGISQGLAPQLEEALQMAAEQAQARGVGRGSIDQALQAITARGVLAPAFLQAQQQFGAAVPQLMGLRNQRAGLLGNLRGQAHSQLGAALQRDLSERSMNTTTTERTFERQRSLLGRIAGAALGTLGGGFLGTLGSGLADSFLGGDGREAPSGTFRGSPGRSASLLGRPGQLSGPPPRHRLDFGNLGFGR